LDIGRVRSCIRPIIATDSMAARPDGDRGSRPHQRVALVALKTLLSIGPLIADYCQLSFLKPFGKTVALDLPVGPIRRAPIVHTIGEKWGSVLRPVHSPFCRGPCRAEQPGVVGNRWNYRVILRNRRNTMSTNKCGLSY
jgi:hypothetical protein